MSPFSLLWNFARSVSNWLWYGVDPDIFLVPQIFSANRFDIDISKLTNLKKVFENCSQLEAFKNAHPSNQPDSE